HGRARGVHGHPRLRRPRRAHSLAGDGRRLLRPLPHPHPWPGTEPTMTDLSQITPNGRAGRADQAIDLPPPRGVDAVPVLTGRHVRPRAVQQGDYPFLVELQSAPETLIRWRYRGATLSPEQIIQSLWQGVLAQFLVVRADTAQPVGLVVCYNPEFRHSY